MTLRPLASPWRDRAPTVRPSDVADWYILDSWLPIYDRFRFAPTDIPGVRALPRGISDRAPFPYEIHRTHLAMLGLPTPIVPKVSDASILRPHQHVGVDFIRSRRGTLLADEPRVGKSATTMYAFEPEAGPLLVAGPVASRTVWSEWAHRRFGACVEAGGDGIALRGRPCSMCARLGIKPSDQLMGRPSFLALDGRTYDVSLIVEARPLVLFCTHAVLSTWRELSMSLIGAAGLTRLGMFAYDEAHIGGLVSRKSLTHESARWLNSITERVVLLSGTPKPNKPSGLWSLLDIAAPAAFGDFWTCARRHFAAEATAHGWKADGLSNESELNLRMREIMLRRTWKEVAPNLPPITRTMESVAIPLAKRDAIEETAARMRLAAGNAKTQIGIMARLRRLFADAKLEAGADAICAALESGRSVIGWTWHQDTSQQLVSRLRERGALVYGPITGAVTGHAREHILDEAAAPHGGPRVLVANMATLGTAVSLAWADHAVFVELDFAPHVLSQAEARVFDPSRPCSATYLVGDCPTDEELASALLTKLDQQSALGLRAGVGDVAEVLQRTFKLEGQTLDELADRLCANAEGEI